jgi:hypothetical protein
MTASATSLAAYAGTLVASSQRDAPQKIVNRRDPSIAALGIAPISIAPMSLVNKQQGRSDDVADPAILQTSAYRIRFSY